MGPLRITFLYLCLLPLVKSPCLRNNFPTAGCGRRCWPKVGEPGAGLRDVAPRGRLQSNTAGCWHLPLGTWVQALECSPPGLSVGVGNGHSKLGSAHVAMQNTRWERLRPGQGPSGGHGSPPAPARLPGPRVGRSRDRSWAEPGGRGSPEQGGHVSGAGRGRGQAALT